VVKRHEHSKRARYDLNLQRCLADHLAVTLNRQGLVRVHGHGPSGWQILDVPFFAMAAAENAVANAEVIEQGPGPQDADVDLSVAHANVRALPQLRRTQTAAIGQYHLKGPRPAPLSVGRDREPVRLKANESR